MTALRPVRFMDRSTPPKLVTLVLLAGISVLGMNIFVPSLAIMAEYFETGYAVMQLSVSLYLGVNAGLQLVIGPMSDKLGRRPVIIGGLVIFVLATFGCMLAESAVVFLIFRMMQAGVVSAMVLSRAVVRDMVPQDQAASMIGYVTMGMSVVPMLGPAVGGVLADVYGWQASFLLLLVLGLGMIVWTWADLGETARPSGLSFAKQFAEYPELLRSPRFWGYAMAAAFASGSFFAYMGGAAFVGTEVFGMDQTVLGIVFGAPALGYFTGNFVSGRYSRRFGINKMIFWGAVINFCGIAGSLTLFLSGMGSASVFFGSMVFVGIGNGMVLPNATAGTLSVRPHLAGTASGLGGAINIGGGAALSQVAGELLGPQTGATPLLWLQFLTAFAAILAIVYVIRRTSRLEALDEAT